LLVAGPLLILSLGGLSAVANPRGRAGWIAAVTMAISVLVLVPAFVVLLRSPLQPTSRSPVQRTGMGLPGQIFVIACLLGLMTWAAALIGFDKGTRTYGPGTLRPARTLRPTSGGGGGFSAGPWIAVALGVALLLIYGGAALQKWRAGRVTEDAKPEPTDPLAAAVDAALLDLEGEQNARRAVIKAYARTEMVLRDHGLPRFRAEAPLEYLDRVLRQLGAQAEAVDRLTRLFEQAAFSVHHVDAAMRAEAVATFHGLRETLADAGHS
jgi:hypothetical protein